MTEYEPLSYKCEGGQPRNEVISILEALIETLNAKNLREGAFFRFKIRVEEIG